MDTYGPFTRWVISWYWFDGLYEVIYFIKSDRPRKSVGFLGSVRLSEVNYFIKSFGQVPWDIPSCKRSFFSTESLLSEKYIALGQEDHIL
jgi:hypothetical protein